MRNLVINIIGVVLMSIFVIYLFYSPKLKFDVLENPKQNDASNHAYKQKEPKYENKKLEKGVGTWIGKPLSHLTQKYGQAERSYPYKNGFKQYVFRGKDTYYLVTTKKDSIKSVYATGKKAQVHPFKVRGNASKVFEHAYINPEVEIKDQDESKEIELSDEDLKTQTLIQYKDTYAQVYSDQETHKILAVRYLDAEALATFEPYTNKEDSEDAKEEADSVPYSQNANQLMTLYEITNEMRKIKGIKPLKISNELGDIAEVNLYNALTEDQTEFTEDALRRELDRNEIRYDQLGLNVGYGFNDVPSVVHNWLNSDSHRSRMLNSKYSEMGGEIKDHYYTLLFLKRES
ncbi:CAP-associated domain-containing protein [Staphylococcus massiliensis]|uniref:CAP-associated domain-containing protein n=1 Tax=Staphylococcus massiliensis TaxID=555791 RepID=UPI001EDE91E8|nr:CAP-associated domain-containing protein [Staphylococcus massiliensis]MCG3400505.1 SCP-like extracellular protein [Staphylococcus massiliensis]